jgi:hypothetical protein
MDPTSTQFVIGNPFWHIQLQCFQLLTPVINQKTQHLTCWNKELRRRQLQLDKILIQAPMNFQTNFQKSFSILEML